MPKPGKLQKLISNASIKDDMVIAVGDESFTMGELRSMDAESEGGSTADLEAREANLVRAQSALAETLQKAADKMGVSIDKLIDGQLEDVVPRRGAPNADDDESELLADVDPRILSALEKRLEKKLGSATSAAAITKIEKDLADTRKALGIALKVNMDDHYQDVWDKLSSNIPKDSDGKPLVDINLDRALKYADEQGLRDRTGRYNVRKAFDDLTLDARHKSDIAAAERRGEERAEQKRLADAAKPGGGVRQQHLKPPVDDKGRTHTIEHQLQEAMGDQEIQRMLAGVPAGGVQ